MTPPIQEYLAAKIKILEAATPGPWTSTHDKYDGEVFIETKLTHQLGGTGHDYELLDGLDNETSDFIADSRNNRANELRALACAVDALNNRLEGVDPYVARVCEETLTQISQILNGGK